MFFSLDRWTRLHQSCRPSTSSLLLFVSLRAIYCFEQDCHWRLALPCKANSQISKAMRRRSPSRSRLRTPRHRPPSTCFPIGIIHLCSVFLSKLNGSRWRYSAFNMPSVVITPVLCPTKTLCNAIFETVVDRTMFIGRPTLLDTKINENINRSNADVVNTEGINI